VPKLRFPQFQVAEVWQYAKVDALVDTITPPKKLSTSSYGSSGAFPIIDQSQNRICGWTDDQKALIQEDLPLIIFGDHTCILKFVDRPFAQGADGIKILRCRPKVDAAYLYQFLSYKTVITEKYKRHYAILKDKLVMFPDFKQGEQQKIANCLASLDDLIAAQKRKVEALKTYKHGLIQQLFPREGETVPRLRFPEFHDAPRWRLRPIGDLLQEIPRPIVMDDDIKYTLVKVKRRYGGVVNREILKGQAIKVKSQFVVEEGDFLISKRQIVHNACGIVPPELDKAIVSNEYSVLGPKKGCDVEFFNYFVQQQAVSASFLNSSVGIVIEKMLFKLNTWLKHEFYFPSVDEQRKIAAVLASAENGLAIESEKLESLLSHKRGLMQQLFPALERV
jgi:type I restriction enzyme, S subunit